MVFETIKKDKSNTNEVDKVKSTIEQVNLNTEDDSKKKTKSLFESKDGEENDYYEESEEDEDEEIHTPKKHRPTFCGTAEYVSPEMLFGEEVCYEVDYWALGCILYKLITGYSPFKEKSQFLVFQNIKTLSIKWTKEITTEAKDLIKKLLKHKPEERIGSKSIDEIITHEFFYDEKKENVIYKMKPNTIPFKDKLKTKTMIIEEQKLKISDTEKLKEKEKDKIIIIKEQVVEKKSPYFHYNTRILRLDSTPKLEYIDPDSKVIKGTIYLNAECSAKVLSTTKFELITPKRTFLFKVNDDEAGVWGKKINEEINKLSDKPA